MSIQQAYYMDFGAFVGVIGNNKSQIFLFFCFTNCNSLALYSCNLLVSKFLHSDLEKTDLYTQQKFIHHNLNSHSH